MAAPGITMSGEKIGSAWKFVATCAAASARLALSSSAICRSCSGVDVGGGGGGVGARCPDQLDIGGGGGGRGCPESSRKSATAGGRIGSGSACALRLRISGCSLNTLTRTSQPKGLSVLFVARTGELPAEAPAATARAGEPPDESPATTEELGASVDRT